MDDTRVIIVMLRTPRRDSNEMRTDPLWEFGSFGCTRCHQSNLMNPRKLGERNGARFAFAQGGPRGVRLVHVTPPVGMLDHGTFGEAKWEPADMPLRYDGAPLLVNEFGASDVPVLIGMIEDVRRGTPVAQFASKFRSRCEPLPDRIGREVVEVYDHFRAGGAAVAESYAEALPWPPPSVDEDRRATYRGLLGDPRC